MAQITQAQYNTSKQTIRNVYIRVNLLNFNYLTIDSFSGNVIGGSLASDANSNMRNTCDMTLVVTDSSFDVQAEGKIWLDRLIQVFIGVEDMRTGEVAWTNKGIFLINQPAYSFDAKTNTMTFQGVDLMGLMTGLRGGMLTDSYIIPQGSNVRDAIVACLKENGFNKYIVSECTNVDGTIQNVPYDIQHDAGDSWWDVLESLQSILPNYQMYFDIDGIFHYEVIPYRANEQIRMSDDIWVQNVTGESVSYDFESVKNSVKVLGKTHDIQYYPSTQTVSGGTLTLTIGALSEVKAGIMIGFTPPANMATAVSLNVNNNGAKALRDGSGNQITSLSKDVYYCALYVGDDDYWLFLGHNQAVGEWKDNNPDSPFYIGNPAGEIKIVLYGDDYENIMSDELAIARAKWEIWQRCRLNDTVQLTTVPIYWAEVNWMVSYTPRGGTEANQYLIISIQTDLSPTGTQTYELVRYYPYYDENDIL